MSQIYKVKLLDKNNIQKIFVFKGKYDINEDQIKLQVFLEIFLFFQK